MKPGMLIPVALLLGLVVGAWGPRSQLKHARSEVKRLEGLLKDQGGAARAVRLDGITRMLRIPEAEKGGDASSGDAPADGPPEGTGQAATDSVDVAEQRTAADNEVAGDEGRSGEGGGQRDLSQRIDEAVELWKLRSDIARSTFISNTGLSPEEAAQFDVVVEAMNMRLGERIDAWSEQLKQEEFEMTEETGVRMMSELSNVMVLTYDEMNRKMPEDWRRNAGNEFNLTDMIDPSVATPLIDVEGKLERRPRRRRFGPP